MTKQEEYKSTDEKPEDILDQLLKLSDPTHRKTNFTVRVGGAGDMCEL